MSSDVHDSRGFFVSAHDEPIVIDNSPARVELWPRKVPTQVSADTWSRDCMPLSSLVIMSHEGNDDVPEGRVFKLAPDADVILTLKEGGEEELLTFTPGNGQLRMQSAKIFMRESGTHRLVQANNGRLRVVRVQGKTRGGGSIDEPLDRGPKKVFIVITPLPE